MMNRVKIRKEALNIPSNKKQQNMASLFCCEPGIDQGIVRSNAKFGVEIMNNVM
jgi:hypothetical protein